MAIKKNLIDDPNFDFSTSISSPGLGGLADLFKPQEVLSDDRSITVLKPLKILGFHRRVSFIEKGSQKNSIFTDTFSITVPVGTVHIASTVEDLLLTYGETKVILLGNSGYSFEVTKSKRDPLSFVGVTLKVDRIGDIHPGGGQPPQLVRTADITVNLIVHSGKALPSFGAATKFTLLFLGEE